MYYQSYEEYMRDILGYPRRVEETSYNNYGIEQNNYEMMNQDIEKLYPEIYKITYPMVCKACNQYKGEITKELVERLTDEVCSNLEIEELRGEEKAKQEVRSSTQTSKTTNTSKIEGSKVEQECRYKKTNSTLRDLVKILIIRELLQRYRRPQGRFPYMRNAKFSKRE